MMPAFIRGRRRSFSRTRFMNGIKTSTPKRFTDRPHKHNANEPGILLIPPLYARTWIAWIVWLWLWTLPKTRFERFGLAVAWHIGAAWHIALLGQKFFGGAFLSWLVLPLWVALVAIPY